MNKGQSSIDYVLMIVLALLLVVAVFVLVRGNIFSPSISEAGNSSDAIKSAIASVMPT